ncbi:MAG: hypothetical protein NTW86_15845 [Candidatus Sumerlaeota bacterium]|nr:hypothetical protein [Candidatus Sumerlaeota bacterium]
MTQLPGLELVGQLPAASGDLEVAPLPSPRIAAAPGMQSPPPAGSRKVHDLREGWALLSIDPQTGALRGAERITVPHVWPNDRDYRAAWHVLRLKMSKRRGERLFVRFEQAPLFCALFVNGRECGHHWGSFTSFEFDVTDAVVEGANLFAVYVHDEWAGIEGDKALCQMGLSRFPEVDKTHPYAFPARGGLWGDATLERRAEAFVNDVFVKTSTRRKEMTLVCEVVNAGSTPQSVGLDFSLVEWPDGAPVDLAIPAQEIAVAPGAIQTLSVRVRWDNPRLWSTEHPDLYVLYTAAKTDRGLDTLATRFGFREFWVEGKQFMLNGFPVRLRGESTYRFTPNRDLNREIFLIYKRELGVNAVRSSATIGPAAVYHAADEAGLLLNVQSAIWSAMGRGYRAGGERFLENARREFGEWIRRDRNCPSIVIWDAENEMLRDAHWELNRPWAMRLDDFIREHDDTRPIEHSGAGWYDRNQDIIHIHMHEHYSRVMTEWKARGRRPLVMGEFWVGGRGEERLPSSKEAHSNQGFFEEEARMYELAMLEMRCHGVWGIMPLTLRITAFVNPEDGGKWYSCAPGSKPTYTTRSPLVIERLRHGLGDVTVFFWPPAEAAIAGETMQRELVVCNDSESPREFELEWGMEGDQTRRERLSMQPAEQRRIAVEEKVPAGNTMLTARLLEGGAVLSRDTLEACAIPRDRLVAPKTQRRAVVYEGRTVGAMETLRRLGVQAVTCAEVPEGDPRDILWIIAPGAADATLNRRAAALRTFLEAGGRILCLAQEKWPRWPPIRLGFWPAARVVSPPFRAFGFPESDRSFYYSKYAPIYAPSHPIFDGIRAKDLRWWAENDGHVSEDALVRPAAVGARAPGAWRALVGACRYESASLVEARVGDGLLILCQLDVIGQSKYVEARALLYNMLAYLDGMGWSGVSRNVSLAGNLTAERLSALTGADAELLRGASPERGGVLLAGDNASVEELDRWAEAGGTVLVLSAETANRLPGFAVRREEGMAYAGSRGEDHSLFWGIASTNFADFDHPIIQGELVAYPSESRILFHGLKAQREHMWLSGTSVDHFMKKPSAPDAAGPAAVSTPHGRGEWIVTTWTPWLGRSPHDAELLSTILANCNVALAIPPRHRQRVRAFQTVALEITGNLDRWTDDMEDKNVSPYCHAEPIVLSFEDAVAGAPQNDAECSAIMYFLWDSRYFYAAGAAFGPGDDVVTMRLGESTLRIHPIGEGALASIAGPRSTALEAAGRRLPSPDAIVDARNLAFAVIDPRVGDLRAQGRVATRTFETRVPWRALGFAAPPSELRALIRLAPNKGTILQAPLEAREDAPNTWLSVALAPGYK